MSKIFLLVRDSDGKRLANRLFNVDESKCGYEQLSSKDEQDAYDIQSLINEILYENQESDITVQICRLED